MAKPTNAKPRPSGSPDAKGRRSSDASGKGARAAQQSGGQGAATATRSTPRPSWAVPAIAVGVVVALLAVALVVTRLGGGDEEAELLQTRPVSVTGTPLPPLVKDGTDAAVGTKAPVVSGASFDGKPVEIGGRGRAAMIFFVAHWCPHCQREVPLLAPELGRITPPGVEVLTVATSTQANAPNYPPSKWLREQNWPSPVLADDADNPAGNAFGVNGYPFYVLLGVDGTVVRRGSGEKTVAEVEDLLQLVAPPAG